MRPGYAIGSYRGEHLTGVLDVLRDALPCDPVSRSVFVRKALLDPNFDPDGGRVAVVEGNVAGFALALVRRFALEDAPPEVGVGWITLLGVRTDHRHAGIGSALLDDAERFLVSRGCRTAAISPYAPGYFTPGVDEQACAQGLAFLQKRGYEVVSRPIAMECDLAAIRMPSWLSGREAALAAQGTHVVPYTPELIPALFAFLGEHFRGDWQRFARTAIDRIEQGEAPTRVWLATCGDSVIGFSHHEVERFGPIGVHPHERGRGIGHLLMYRTLESMRLQGLHCAWFLWSDERTADRLYRAAGFRITRRFAILRKEIG
ncbi:MAG: GNAT family N-acetyltransferase [Chthonomonadales bacterium]|nr:GNAT family N-acetyltransferase [Chthonomonadales bacterium]